MPQRRGGYNNRQSLEEPRKLILHEGALREVEIENMRLANADLSFELPDPSCREILLVT